MVAQITPDVEAAARNNEMFSRFLGEALAIVSLKERAMDWLENAVRIGLTSYPYLRQHDGMLDNLRGEPDFEELLRHVEEKWRGAVNRPRA